MGVGEKSGSVENSYTGYHIAVAARADIREQPKKRYAEPIALVFC